jgi:hypothetical protein
MIAKVRRRAISAAGVKGRELGSKRPGAGTGKRKMGAFAV